MPFVLILGVATSISAVMKVFSFTETTRIKIRGFSAHSPNQILNEIQNEIILTPRYPFQMSSHVFDYLKGVFLFYDLTTKNFLKAIHHSMLNHYQQGNAYAICTTTFKQSKHNIRRLQHNDLEQIRRLPSFRFYVEAMSNYQDIEAILTDDEFFRKQIVKMVYDIYCYLYKFYGYIRFILCLVKDLPDAPLGKKLNEIYIRFQSNQQLLTETEDFQKCFQLLSMLSKHVFIDILRKGCDALTEYEFRFCDPANAQIDIDMIQNVSANFDKTRNDLQSLMDDLVNDNHNCDANDSQHNQKQNESQVVSRHEYYRNLLEQRKQKQPEITETIQKIIDYIKVNVIEKNIVRMPPLMELFVYSDCDYIRSHLRGSSRSSVHMALINPNYYLQVK